MSLGRTQYAAHVCFWATGGEESSLLPPCSQSLPQQPSSTARKARTHSTSQTMWQAHRAPNPIKRVSGWCNTIIGKTRLQSLQRGVRQTGKVTVHLYGPEHIQICPTSELHSLSTGNPESEPQMNCTPPPVGEERQEVTAGEAGEGLANVLLGMA